ncbi:rod shape-determining protein MreD [Pseudohaliea rubra]|uniref:Rod shape-determining protein MreD n=1 Tax=Pseudohaliea rubra DSM 19751 TaxID=1265313 RepID=A0A095WX76_9GAMM|nr:rod shape-determining protein MreD [Pseudohaliea rubra]KGE03214.1 Rod shape-determining protein MreD [Pseudohaliea rubra DSM 19751]
MVPGEGASGYWVILASFFVACVLAVLPLGPWLAWLRPEWLLLVLTYWVIALPHRVGLVTAALAGLLMDVLEGAVLGQNVLALSLAALLARLLYQRMRVFSLAQQALTVFLIVGLHQLVCQWIQNLEGAGARSFLFLLPAVTSALLWPVVRLVLRAARRYYYVH